MSQIHFISLIYTLLGSGPRQMRPPRRCRLKEVTQNATVLIAAQRVGTIMDADQIINLRQGEIVVEAAEGLMENNAIYREIRHSQLNSRSLTEE